MPSAFSGEGPFTFESPTLASGEEWHLRLKQRDKGRYKRHLPFDEILAKNYDADNRVTIHLNGIYEMDLDPGGKDSDDSIGVARLVVENKGNTQIDAKDVTISLKNHPYDADDRAREIKERGPIEGFVKSKMGL